MMKTRSNITVKDAVKCIFSDFVLQTKSGVHFFLHSGICRVGGRDKFFHCQTCDMCLPKKLENQHRVKISHIPPQHSTNSKISVVCGKNEQNQLSHLSGGYSYFKDSFPHPVMWTFDSSHVFQLFHSSRPLRLPSLSNIYDANGFGI